MKNREKYPNTDEALKAFKKHNEVCDCGCSFEEWLDKDVPIPIIGAVVGLMLGSLLRGNVGPKDKPADKENKKPSNVAGFTEVECPICHGKHGVIDGFLTPSLNCPDCGTYVGINGKATSIFVRSLVDFKFFIADLCKKNNRKD